MKNKKIVITGGSEGLGKLLAQKLTAQGAEVIILSKNKNKLVGTAKEIGCDYIVCDIRDWQNCQDACNQIKEKYGDIDILINNAGIWTDDGLEFKNPLLAKDAIETNLLGAIYMTNCFLPRFRELNRGTIFFTNSVSGRFPIVDPQARTYSASKWGLRGYSESLKEYLKDTKIKIIQLYPCGFDTNLFETSGWDKSTAHNQPWMTSAENIANAAVFALSAPIDINISSVVIEKSGASF